MLSGTRVHSQMENHLWRQGSLWGLKFKPIIQQLQVCGCAIARMGHCVPTWQPQTHKANHVFKHSAHHMRTTLDVRAGTAPLQHPTLLASRRPFALMPAELESAAVALFV